MTIIQKNEACKRVDGKMKFSYAGVFVQHDGMLYYGKWPNRFDSPTTLDDLQEHNQIPTEDRGPEVNATWSAVYIKTPSLLAYIGGNLEQQVAREVEACEIVRKSPHPNLATYYGYQETHGRVSGLCFKRYTASLLETVNPQRLNKVAFRTSGREILKGNMQCGLQGLLAGIKHLHSLGLVHNDVNPANIMLGDDRLFLLILIAVDRSGSRYVIPTLKELPTGTILLSRFRWKKMISMLLKSSKSGSLAHWLSG